MNLRTVADILCFRAKAQERAVAVATLAVEKANYAAHPIPAHWNPIDPAHGNTSLVLLTEKDHAAELAEVHQHYSSTNGLGKLLSVHRVQNEEQWKRFEQKRLELAEQALTVGEPAPASLKVYRQLSDELLIHML
jgi:hypothetical protein